MKRGITIAIKDELVIGREQRRRFIRGRFVESEARGMIINMQIYIGCWMLTYGVIALTTPAYFDWENSAERVLIMALVRSTFDWAVCQRVEP